MRHECQAFPSVANWRDHEGSEHTTIEPGMSLRDYFAAKAMAAIINDTWRADRPDDFLSRDFIRIIK